MREQKFKQPIPFTTDVNARRQADRVFNQTMNQYATMPINPEPMPPSITPYMQTNAQSLLSLALKDALLGNPRSGQDYLDMLTGNVGVVTSGGYNIDLGYNTPNPLNQSGANYPNLDLELGVSFPFEV